MNLTQDQRSTYETLKIKQHLFHFIPFNSILIPLYSLICWCGLIHNLQKSDVNERKTLRREIIGYFETTANYYMLVRPTVKVPSNRTVSKTIWFWIENSNSEYRSPFQTNQNEQAILCLCFIVSDVVVTCEVENEEKQKQKCRKRMMRKLIEMLLNQPKSCKTNPHSFILTC